MYAVVFSIIFATSYVFFYSLRGCLIYNIMYLNILYRVSVHIYVDLDVKNILRNKFPFKLS